MTYITHSIGGVGAGLLILSISAYAGDATAEAAVMSGAVLGSLFPDIDHKQSLIGRKAPATSHLASGVFKHRGFLHSPLFILLAAALLTAGARIFLSGAELVASECFITGFIPGMISHILLDTLNKQGIPWLWPYKKRFRLLPIRTDSVTETALAALLAVLIGYNFIH